MHSSTSGLGRMRRCLLSEVFFFRQEEPTERRNAAGVSLAACVFTARQTSSCCDPDKSRRLPVTYLAFPEVRPCLPLTARCSRVHARHLSSILPPLTPVSTLCHLCTMFLSHFQQHRLYMISQGGFLSSYITSFFLLCTGLRGGFVCLCLHVCVCVWVICLQDHLSIWVWCPETSLGLLCAPFCTH